jgi:hypothetical protein
VLEGLGLADASKRTTNSIFDEAADSREDLLIFDGPGLEIFKGFGIESDDHKSSEDI